MVRRSFGLLYGERVVIIVNYQRLRLAILPITFFQFRLFEHSSIFLNFLPVVVTTDIYRILILFFVKNAHEKMQEEIREQIVRALHTGLDSSEIVKTVNVSRKTVYNIKNRLLSEGNSGLA